MPGLIHGSNIINMDQYITGNVNDLNKKRQIKPEQKPRIYIPYKGTYYKMFLPPTFNFTLDSANEELIQREQLIQENRMKEHRRRQIYWRKVTDHLIKAREENRIKQEASRIAQVMGNARRAFEALRQQLFGGEYDSNSKDKQAMKDLMDELERRNLMISQLRGEQEQLLQHSLMMSKKLNMKRNEIEMLNEKYQAIVEIFNKTKGENSELNQTKDLLERSMNDSAYLYQELEYKYNETNSRVQSLEQQLQEMGDRKGNQETYEMFDVDVQTVPDDRILFSDKDRFHLRMTNDGSINPTFSLIYDHDNKPFETLLDFSAKKVYGDVERTGGNLIYKGMEVNTEGMMLLKNRNPNIQHFTFACEYDKNRTLAELEETSGREFPNTFFTYHDDRYPDLWEGDLSNTNLVYQLHNGDRLFAGSYSNSSIELLISLLHHVNYDLPHSFVIPIFLTNINYEGIWEQNTLKYASLYLGHQISHKIRPVHSNYHALTLQKRRVSYVAKKSEKPAQTTVSATIAIGPGFIAISDAIFLIKFTPEGNPDIISYVHSQSEINYIAVSYILTTGLVAKNTPNPPSLAYTKKQKSVVWGVREH